MTTIYLAEPLPVAREDAIYWALIHLLGGVGFAEIGMGAGFINVYTSESNKIQMVLDFLALQPDCTVTEIAGEAAA
jgi:hypothetical protein